MNPLLTPEAQERFWNRDGSLWSSETQVQEFIHRFMGWTDIAERMLPRVDELQSFAKHVVEEGFTDVLVCGMGGSSLGSLVLRDVFGDDAPLKVHVLDSTSPGTVLGFRKSLTLDKTLFLVASKSGTTVEPKAFEEFFWSECLKEFGLVEAARRFVAITDPGSQMHIEAQSRNYRRIFLGEPEIGGRFSVLSLFGLVTAALLGVDLHGFLSRAVQAGRGQSTEGFEFGVWLAEHAQAGREKVTLLTAPGLESFGLWAEQLVAESTGKQGKGILPIATEPVKQLDQYTDDRVFVGLRYDDAAGAVTTKLVQALEAQGRPARERVLADKLDLAAEFMTWEVATAVAGAVIGVNPFDQPNVESAKVLARQKLTEVKNGENIAIKGGHEVGKLKLHGAAGLGEFLADAPESPYVAFLAYIDESPEADEVFRKIRETLPMVTTFGYGPRYLHSTGQYHKGGPANGAFVVVVGEDEEDADIPGMGVTFGQLKTAQAVGDVEALRAEGRPVLLVKCKRPADLEALLD